MSVMQVKITVSPEQFQTACEVFNRGRTSPDGNLPVMPFAETTVIADPAITDNLYRIEVLS